VFEQMKKALLAWNESVSASFAGQDYPEGKVTPPDPQSISWTESPLYQPHLVDLMKRPEYQPSKREAKKGKKKAE
jgi:hypothetical protein